jgi:hypothetical protein
MSRSVRTAVCADTWADIAHEVSTLVHSQLETKVSRGGTSDIWDFVWSEVLQPVHAEVKWPI